MVLNGPSTYNTVSSHFAAQIDINGDCFSDLVMLSGANNNLLEIYTKNNHNSYEYSFIDLTKNMKWMSFTDLDANGAPDMLLVSLEQGNYLPYALLSSNTPGDICSPFSTPSFDPANLKAISLPKGYQILSDSNLKIGDFNFDGYPDILGVYSIDSFRKVSILSNRHDLVFNVLDADMAPLQQISNPLQACLYDFS